MPSFEIIELSSNGDWFSYIKQEMFRLPLMARRYQAWHWPLAFVIAGMGVLYFSLPGIKLKSDDLACFGWHCVAIKK